MLNNDLSDFLGKIISPEAVDIILNAYDTLSQTGEIKHEFAIEQIMQMEGLADNSTTVASIEEAVKNTLEDRLSSYGVLLIETDLIYAPEILNGLSLVTEYGDPMTIYTLISDTEDYEACFCDIMQLVTPFHSDVLITKVQKIDPALVTRLHDIIVEQINTSSIDEDNQKDELLLNPIRARLMPFVAIHPNCLILQLLRASTPLGLDCSIYTENIRDIIVNRNVDEIVIELIGLALASNSSNNDLKLTVKTQIDSLFTTVDELTKATIALSKEGASWIN